MRSESSRSSLPGWTSLCRSFLPERTFFCRSFLPERTFAARRSVCGLQRVFGKKRRRDHRQVFVANGMLIGRRSRQVAKSRPAGVTYREACHE